MASFLQHHLSHTIVPLLLIFTTPNTAILIWYTNEFCGGSFQKLVVDVFQHHGFYSGLKLIWERTGGPTPFAAATVLGYMAFALVLMRLVPGKIAYGPPTNNGHIPVYKDNGFKCYLITMAAIAGLHPTSVLDHFGEILVFLNFFSLFFCALLYVKGNLAPSKGEHGCSGNIVFDFYWGTELYPRVFGFDIKVFTNCRFGMTVWPMLIVLNAFRTYENLNYLPNSTIVFTVLQMAYLTKFFWWEAGYMKTIDIMTDRAGYYICWGCLVWIAGFYCSAAHYLRANPVNLTNTFANSVFVIGFLCLVTNYWADFQRQIVRETQGQCRIWGRRPVLIKAKYRSDDGEVKTNLLLASGFWGLARHFNYVPELGLALCWALCSGFNHLLPYCYFIFLTVLLVHRSFRDEAKCSKKYGTYWKEYSVKVPYKMVPFVF